MRAPSETAKAYAGSLVTILGVIAATFVETTLGKVASVLGAGIGAWLAIYTTKNTQAVRTGVGDEPVTIGQVVSDTGQVVGQITADTGSAVGGVVAGTTGVVGKVLDATVGLVIPSGQRRAA